MSAKDDYTFFPITRTRTVNGVRVDSVMAIHKSTGDTHFFTEEQLEILKKSNIPVTFCTETDKRVEECQCAVCRAPKAPKTFRT